MQPSFPLAELYVQGSLARQAHSALPGSPVHPPARRLRQRLGRRFRRSAPQRS